MQYPIIDSLTNAYIRNGWTGLDIPSTITYTYRQLGTGTPSPDNVRPIIPGAVLNVGGQNMPVYSGVLDTQNRTLTIDFDYVDLNSVDVASADPRYARVILAESNILGRPGDSICSFLSRWTGSAGTIPLNYFNVYYSAGYGATQLIINMGDTVTSSLPVEKRNAVRGEINILRNQGYDLKVIYNLSTPYVYNLSASELSSAIEYSGYGIKNKLKLPMIRYFPHAVIDSLNRANDGTMTSDDIQILRHYLSPLGIGNIELGNFRSIRPVTENKKVEYKYDLKIEDFPVKEKTGEGDLNVKTE